MNKLLNSQKIPTRGDRTTTPIVTGRQIPRQSGSTASGPDMTRCAASGFASLTTTARIIWESQTTVPMRSFRHCGTATVPMREEKQSGRETGDCFPAVDTGNRCHPYRLVPPKMGGFFVGLHMKGKAMSRRKRTKPLWVMRADPQVLGATIPCTRVPGSTPAGKPQESLHTKSADSVSLVRTVRRYRMLFRTLRSRCKCPNTRNQIGIQLERLTDLEPFTDKKLSRWVNQSWPVIVAASHKCRVDLITDSSGLPQIA